MSAQQIPLAGKPPTRAPRLSVLSPILGLTEYYLRAKAIHEIVMASAEVVRAGGLTGEVDCDFFSDSKSAFIEAFTDGTTRPSCGGTATLRIAHRHRIDLLLASPASLSVRLDHGGILALTPRRLRSVLDVEICSRVSTEIADLARKVGAEWTIERRSDHVVTNAGSVAV